MKENKMQVNNFEVINLWGRIIGKQHTMPSSFDAFIRSKYL